MAVEPSEMRRSWLKPAAREELTGWLFASPWIIGFLLFTVGPMVFSLYTSFTKYNILSAPKWIGLENYRYMFFSDPMFWKALTNTLWMVVVRTPVIMIAAMSIALLLNTGMRGERGFRTIIYLPNVLSGVAAIFLWQWILNPQGLLNTVLGTFGIKGPGWFVDPRWTKPGMVIMALWWIGGNVLIYLAGLKGISRDLYEAASIDGANSWQRLRNITLPLLTPTIFFEVITAIIAAFQIFTTAFILAGKEAYLSGPSQSLLFYVLYLYNRAFGKIGQGGLQMGYASALAWVLFFIILIITLVQLRMSKRWVYYETDK